MFLDMTSEEITAMCFVFFIAGFVTTTSWLSMAVRSLAEQPDIQERLYRENETVIAQLIQEKNSKEKGGSLSLSGEGDKNTVNTEAFKVITWENLTEFKYLRAVLDETLRLYPPGAAIERTATEDAVLTTSNDQEIYVKRGDIVHIATYSMHRDGKHFGPDPNVFNPDRFLKQKIESSRHKYAFLPFGAGPKNCIGQVLAYEEASLAMIHLLRRYRFQLQLNSSTSEQEVQFASIFNLMVPKSVKVVVEKR